MFRLLQLVFVLFFSLPLYFAQKTGSFDNFIHPIDTRLCQSSYQHVAIGSAKPERIIQYLKYSIPNCKPSNVSLKLISNIESTTGHHLLFQQLVNETPIYRAQIKVNVSKSGTVTSLFDNSFPSQYFNTRNFPSKESAVITTLIDGSNLYSIDNYFFYYESELIPVLRIEELKDDGQHVEYIMNAQEQILYQQDLNSYYHTSTSDSTVSARVFMPDPITSAGVSYTAPYVDNNNADVPQLNAQRANVSMKVHFSNDSFKLQSPYVVIKEFSPPTTIPAHQFQVPSFDYTRAQNEFEDVNTYYHINNFHQHLTTIGHNTICNYPIWIDAHATNADNSFFNPGFTPPRLFFGIGGVDDAEDADVIIHEYSHAMSHSAAPNTNNGTERRAIDEALGDYFASSYSRSINPYKWEDVYTWDGHNEFWSGRKTISSKHYPEDRLNDIYKDAEIWSSTIMQIWNDIGRNEADRLLLESMYSYATGMTMKDAARLYLQADSVLNQYANKTSLCTHFYNRGLTDECIINFNDGKITHLIQAFESSGKLAVSVVFSEKVNIKVDFFDIQGKLLYSEEVTNVMNYVPHLTNYPSGVLIMKVQASANTTLETNTFKVVNIH